MNKTQRIIRLLIILGKGLGATREHCMEMLGLSESSFYEYLKELRDLKFVIERDGTRYKLDLTTSEAKVFSSLFPLDEEDEYLLTKAIEGLDHSSKKQQALILKLKLLFGENSFVEKYLPQKEGEMVRIVEHSIKDKKQVFVRGYASGSSLKKKDYNLEPFYIVNGLELFWAYDLDSKSNKLFKFSRIEEVMEMPFKQEYIHLHQRNDVDDFNFGGDFTKHVRFEMNFLARNLLIEEYPRAEKSISEINSNAFLYENHCVSFDGAARFVLGFSEHCHVLGSEDFKAYVEKKYKRNSPLREIRSKKV